MHVYMYMYMNMCMCICVYSVGMRMCMRMCMCMCVFEESKVTTGFTLYLHLESLRWKTNKGTMSNMA